MFINLQKTSELIIASSKLQTVATGLQKIVDGNKLSDYELEAFNWAGDLYGRLDWHSTLHRNNEHGELESLASELRDIFYKNLLQFAILLDNDYSERTYQTLKSPKDCKLSNEESLQIKTLFEAMHDYALGTLQAGHGRV